MEKIINFLEELVGLSSAEVIAVGAEAVLIQGYLLGESVVVKYRFPKPYRDPQLDLKLRTARTALEARLLAKAGTLGVNVPDIVFLDEDEGVIVTSYIRGARMKDVIETGKIDVRPLIRQAGSMVALLHLNGIIHGDLTTSNFLVEEDKVWLIDFGLGFFSQRDEDRGTDLHLLLRVLESSHPLIANEIFKVFLEGYRMQAGDEMTGRVLQRMQDIRLRGRYVSTRRKSLSGHT